MTPQNNLQSKDSARISAPSSATRGGYTAQSRPLLIWASLPCTGGCSWQHVNILTNREKVEDHHKLFLKLLKSLKSFMRIMKPFNPELAMELPKTCYYWKWAVVQAFIKKHCLQTCLCDGCMLGIVDDGGRPLRKSWQIMSTLPLPGLNGRTCDGTHEHGQSRGHSLKDAESYSYHMTDAIHRDWKQHVAKTTDRVISQRKSFVLSSGEQSYAGHNNGHFRRAHQGLLAGHHVERGPLRRVPGRLWRR